MNVVKPLLRVVVVGLIAQTQQTVRKQVKGVELEFAPHRDGQPRGSFPDADFIVLPTKFISHNHTILAFKQFSRGRVVFAHGGASTVSRAINALAEAN